MVLKIGMKSAAIVFPDTPEMFSCEKIDHFGSNEKPHNHFYFNHLESA